MMEKAWNRGNRELCYMMEKHEKKERERFVTRWKNMKKKDKLCYMMEKDDKTNFISIQTHSHLCKFMFWRTLAMYRLQL